MRETITESDAFVTGGEFDFNRRMVGIEKCQAKMIQDVIHLWPRAGEQLILFAPLLNFAGVVKKKRMFKILVVAAQAERGFLNDDFSCSRNLVIQ